MKALREPACGFTLIEALVAVSLFALILTIVFGSLHLASRGWETVTRIADTNEDLRLGLAFLRREIEQTVPLVFSSGKNTRLLFDGENERIQFVSPLPAHGGGAALHLLELSTLRTDRGERDLKLVYRPVRALREFPVPDDMNAADADRVTVLEGTGDVRFSYYGRARPDEQAQWHDSWRGKSRLPELVRLAVMPGRSGQ